MNIVDYLVRNDNNIRIVTVSIPPLIAGLWLLSHNVERIVDSLPSFSYTQEASIEPQSDSLSGVELHIKSYAERWEKSNELPVLSQPAPQVESYHSELDELVQAAGEELKDPVLINSYRDRLSETTAFRDYITFAHKTTGLDEDLIAAIIATESGGNRYATSKKGAGGLMQFMAKTARFMGLEVTSQLDERYVPSKNVLAGSSYVKDLISNYGVIFGLAFYNHGNKVGKLINKHGKDSAFDFLPQETKDFVNRVLQIFALSKNPEAFGVEIAQQRLYSEILQKGYSHIVREGDTFDGIAKKEGLSRLALREFNIRKDYNLILLREEINIPARNPDYSLKIAANS